jgi:hypothetical protein
MVIGLEAVADHQISGYPLSCQSGFALHVSTSYLHQAVEARGRNRVEGLSSASCSSACVHSDFARDRLALAGSALSTLSSSIVYEMPAEGADR